MRRRDGSLARAGGADARRAAGAALAWPIVRGVVALVEALKLGSRALRFSAEVYERDLEAAEDRRNSEAAEAETRPAVACSRCR